MEFVENTKAVHVFENVTTSEVKQVRFNYCCRKNADVCEIKKNQTRNDTTSF